MQGVVRVHFEKENKMLKNRLSKIVALLVLVISGTAVAQPAPEADERSLLSAFVSYTDLRLRSVQQSLGILAASAEARSAQWKKMQPLLSGYQSADDGLVVWFVRPDGSYYTVDQGLMPVKLSDRDYFSQLMAGAPVMGVLVVSKSTGQRSAVIAVPVKQGGKVVGAIGASLFLDRLSGQLDAALALRPDAAFFALAPNGQTVLHRKTDRHFLDPRELGSESLRKAAADMLANPAGTTSYEFDNDARQALYRTSPLTQWKFAITYRAAAQP
jgi:hypothetical protein